MFILKGQLKHLRRQSSPEHPFKRQLWNRLSEDYNAQYGRPGFGLHLKLVLIPVLAILLFVSLGTGTYAYASSSVGEGHPLFPIKRGIERVEGSFQRSPEAHVRFEKQLLKRREAEMQHKVKLFKSSQINRE